MIHGVVGGWEGMEIRNIQMPQQKEIIDGDTLHTKIIEP